MTGSTIDHVAARLAAPGGVNAQCAGAIPLTFVAIATAWSPALDFTPEPCPGCGLAYLTCAANPLLPHNPAVCKAFKDGYEAGLAAAKRSDP